MFPFPLTAQQQAKRCGCGRFLAWPRTQQGHGSPRCCRCMQPTEQCACQPTQDPNEGCLAVAFVGDPAEGQEAMARPRNPRLARQQLQFARAELQALARRGADATRREWEHARIGEWHAYCQARRAGLDDPEIARLLGLSARVLWERHGQHYPPPR